MNWFSLLCDLSAHNWIFDSQCQYQLSCLQMNRNGGNQVENVGKGVIGRRDEACTVKGIHIGGSNLTWELAYLIMCIARQCLLCWIVGKSKTGTKVRRDTP